jgi:hypothetical protein
MKDVLPLPHPPEDRGGEDVEERRVVVEEVAVGKEPRPPPPRDVEVLRLVGVEAVAEEGEGAE